MTNAVIIYGGNSKKSRLKGLFDKAEQYFKKENVSTETVFVSDLPAEDLISANFHSQEIIKANEKVANAHIVVVLTPVYKSAYTGILKTYLDLLPQKGLEGKTVVPLVLGGSFGHLLSIDYALKPVLSALGATNILSGAYVIDTQVEQISSEHYTIEDEIRERIDKLLALSINEAKRTIPVN
ncbi:NADPH-dependent FMN reductase [Priestia endophytica]|jgi:FMN reductase|uniref:FMN reductase (NADPH) n=1 Tax=Priestia endophytica TaxID=135735 RepID=A0AAX1QB12_9BACI|nr:NADPH-dependent FMN reductase [Priestia endophytica]RAS77636.1 FMN reductase (NADPH) [Priestia endophytica]RAS93011.1 FMN reductase (NADPH) [Priestia endophytica]